MKNKKPRGLAGGHAQPTPHPRPIAGVASPGRAWMIRKNVRKHVRTYVRISRMGWRVRAALQQLVKGWRKNREARAGGRFAKQSEEPKPESRTYVAEPALSERGWL